ncbi:pilus assembly FimT family protein [Enterovibrio norvegicus]|uniref:pilus assembly FimT family protein n=1 Tax=Enterovibrio norvegicus TaxID=188144 RepID=UPI00352F43EE
MKRMKGFTLIEGIITLSVLAVLTAVAVPVYTQHIAQAKADKLAMELKQLVDFASSYSLRRWKPTYIHLINIPNDATTEDTTWCLVASPYSSVTKCTDDEDTTEEIASEKRIATVFGNKHRDIALKRLTTQTKFMFDNNSYSMFLGDDRKENHISFLEAQIGNKTLTAKVNYRYFELE